MIINEFGAVGLDHLLVEVERRADPDARRRLRVLHRARRPRAHRGPTCSRAAPRGTVTPFERIVIETTGLADPAPIVHALMTDRDIAEALRLEAVVATVDAAAGVATLDAHPESVKQAALADCIVVTKTRPRRPGGERPRRARCTALNPSAPKLTARCTARSTRAAFSTVAPYDPARYDQRRRAHRHGGINTFCLRRAAPLHAVDAEPFPAARSPSIAAPGCCG